MSLELSVIHLYSITQHLNSIMYLLHNFGDLNSMCKVYVLLHVYKYILCTCRLHSRQRCQMKMMTCKYSTTLSTYCVVYALWLVAVICSLQWFIELFILHRIWRSLNSELSRQNQFLFDIWLELWLQSSFYYNFCITFVSSSDLHNNLSGFSLLNYLVL